MIRLYSFHTAPSPLLAHQRDMFARFMAEEHELVIVNDGQSPADADAIEAAAASLGLRSEPVPLPERNNPSDGLAAAMEFVVANFLADDEISVLLHADVLAGGPFSLRELIGEADLAAVPEMKVSPDGARVIHYPWSGFVCLRPPRLPARTTIGFGPGLIDGIACDTGGGFRRYLSAHPGLDLVALTAPGVLVAGDAAADAWPNLDVPRPQGRPAERFAGELLHYLGGSGWNPDDAPHHHAKREWFTALCDALLAAELTLPPRTGPAVAPWPADTP